MTSIFIIGLTVAGVILTFLIFSVKSVKNIKKKAENLA